MPRLLDLPESEPEFKRIFGPIREELAALAAKRPRPAEPIESDPLPSEPDPAPLFGQPEKG